MTDWNKMAKISELQIAENYANALFKAAEAENLLEKVRLDCQNLNELIGQTPQINVLNNPEFKLSEKKNLLAQIAKVLNLSQPTVNFLELLAEKRRFNSLRKILDCFKHLDLQKRGILEVSAESVQELSDKQKQKLEKGLEKALNTPIIVNYKINPAILGGLSIQYNSVKVDDSVAGKLQRLEQIMKGNA